MAIFERIIRSCGLFEADLGELRDAEKLLKEHTRCSVQLWYMPMLAPGHQRARPYDHMLEPHGPVLGHHTKEIT